MALGGQGQLWGCAYPEDGAFLSATYNGGDSRALYSVPQTAPLGRSPVMAERTWHIASAGLRPVTAIIIIGVTVSTMCEHL